MKDPLVEEFQKISSNRLILPEILQVINGALPVPQKELTATAPADYKKAAQTIERSQRNQVFVSKLGLDYVPDLTEDAIKSIENANRSVGNLTISRTQTQGEMRGGMMGGPGMMPGMMGGPGMMPGGPGMGGLE